VGIGIRLILTSEWERGGMGIDYMGMGGNVNIKIHSRSSLTYHYLLLTAYFLDCQLVFFHMHVLLFILPFTIATPTAFNCVACTLVTRFFVDKYSKKLLRVKFA